MDGGLAEGVVVGDKGMGDGRGGGARPVNGRGGVKLEVWEGKP